ncbi:MAG TPA: class IV adenylate cyclase [Anaerolineae bacterium]|jgi:predicted adenylyl cyclase CyaB
MASNIEIKARVKNPAALRQLAEEISDTPCETLQQEDIFFNVPHGRLKLRILAPARGELIYYTREDTSGPKRSDYSIFRTAEPDVLKGVLASAYGVRGVVKKVRLLYLAGQTRIHLDDVAGLGSYMELEVVLRAQQSNAEGQAIADDLMAKLDIQKEDLIDVAYIDLLQPLAP